MNYGKKSVSKTRNSLISRTAMMGKRAHVSFIRVLFAVLSTICVVVGCVGIGAFRGIIDNAPDVMILIFHHWVMRHFYMMEMAISFAS